MLLLDPQLDESNTAHDSLFAPSHQTFCSVHSEIQPLKLLIRHLRLCCTCRKRERERPCCCFCSSNEMPSDLFMNYLFGTAPLCSVHFSYPLWSHVAQWLLMQLFVIQSLPSPPVSLRGGLYLSWHVPGCVGGGSDSLSRCEHPLPYCYMPNKSFPAHKLVQGRIMIAIEQTHHNKSLHWTGAKSQG